MNIYEIVQEYKNNLVFWGTMSNQKTFPKGRKTDIFKEVEDRVLNIENNAHMILSPSNTLGKDVPIENINYFVEACIQFCE